MENGEADHVKFSNGISATDANTQPAPHVLNASVTTSNLTTSRTEVFTNGESGKRSEIETMMHTRYYWLQGDKGISRHGLPIIINREPANSAQSPAQSPSPSNASFPMSPSLPSPRLPAAPTPSPIFAVQTEPRSLLQLSLVTADADGRDGLQPITMAATFKKSAEALSELNGKLTRRISAGKSKEPDVEDSQIGSPDTAAPSVLLSPPSKTSLIYAKSPSTPASFLSAKQSQTNCDSSLLSFLFCCTRGGHPSSRPPQHPQQLPVKHVTPITESSFPRSEDNVLVHGHDGSGFRILAQLLPKISRKGREHGNEKRSKLGDKEQSKPGDFFKVAATDVDSLPRANAGHTEIRGTEKIIDSSPLTPAAARDPTANIIAHVSPENSPTTAVRRQSTVFGHHIRPEKRLLTPMDAGDVGKKCLVLDLDETLVHSSFTLITQPDYVVPVEIESAIHNVYVVKRPGVDAFLKKMGELFEVVVFTASLEKYADPVLDMLDKHKVVKHRLFRESCYHHNGNYVKDLSQLGRDIGSVIIIDNSPSSYIFHPKNAVPITSWFNDPLDTELSDLIPFLEDLTMVENVTVVLDQAG